MNKAVKQNKNMGKYIANQRKFNKLIRQANELGPIEYDEAKSRTLEYVANEFEKWRPHFKVATGIVVDFKLRLLNSKGEIHNIHPRHYPEYAEWRLSVFKRDNFTCRKCGSKEKIEAHHIEQYALNADLRLDINNGLTLCRECHKKIPRKRLTK